MENTTKAAENTTQSGIAKEAGCTKQRINALVKNGTLKPALRVVPGRKKPLLNRIVALEILASLDPAQKRGKPDTAYHEAKTAELKAKVERLRFENDVRRGKFVSKDTADRQMALMLSCARQSFENATVELSHELAVETDPHKIYVISAKILNRALYQMKAAAGITEAASEGVSKSEIKKALAMVEASPAGKITAAKLYDEVLRSASYGLDFCEDLDVKKPGKYDSAFLHDPIIYAVYTSFSRLRRSLLDPDAAIDSILRFFWVEIKSLRNEIDKIIIGEGADIGAEYKALLRSGASALK